MYAPDEKAQTCLRYLPHVGPFYNSFGNCLPVSSSSLLALPHSFDLEPVILHSGDFRDHQLFSYFSGGFRSHFWDLPCPAVTTQLSPSVVGISLVDCLFHAPFVPCMNCGFSKLYHWISSNKSLTFSSL